MNHSSTAPGAPIEERVCREYELAQQLVGIVLQRPTLREEVFQDLPPWEFPVGAPKLLAEAISKVPIREDGTLDELALLDACPSEVRSFLPALSEATSVVVCGTSVDRAVCMRLTRDILRTRQHNESVALADQLLQDYNAGRITGEEYKARVADLRIPQTGDIEIVESAALSLDELEEQYGADDWVDVVQGLVPEQSSWLMAAEPKLGKSTTSLVMACHVATGRPFLGHDVQQRNVALYMKEDKAPVTVARLRAICQGMGVRYEDVKPHIRVIPHGMRKDGRPARNYMLDEPADLRDLIHALKPLKPGMLVLDSLTKLHRQEENSASGMRIVTDALDRIACETGAAPGIIHHFNRGEMEDLIRRIRGSGEIIAGMRSCVAMALKDGAIRTIAVGNGRMARPFRFKLDFLDEQGRSLQDDDDAGKLFEIQSRRCTEDELDHRAHQLNQLIGFVKSNSRGVTTEEMRGALGLRESAVRELRDEAVRAGLICQVGGQRGRWHSNPNQEEFNHDQS